MCLWNMAAGDRTIVGEIDLRSNIVASRCPMPVITLYVNIPASCSTLNYPLVPSLYRTSICIRFLEPAENKIGIRPGTGGDQISPELSCYPVLDRIVLFSGIMLDLKVF